MNTIQCKTHFFWYEETYFIYETHSIIVPQAVMQISVILELRVSVILEFRISVILMFRVSVILEFRASVILEFRVSVIPEFRVYGFFIHASFCPYPSCDQYGQ